MEKHFFLGSNTPDGFYGCFDELLDISKVIILKGGAGTGKSTLIKKIGDFAKTKGLDTEYYHCSSDIKSLDGIYIPELNWSILDGTSPHAVDGTMPAINQFIFNLAKGVNTAQISEHSQTIESLLKCKKTHFNNAFSYLKSSFYINELIDNAILASCNTDYLNSLAYDMFKHLSSFESNISRNLFAEAITPQGIVSYADSCFSFTNNVYLKTNYKALSNFVINKIKQKCLANNIGHITYLSPFNPKVANALQIGNYAITSDDNVLKNHLIYDLNCTVDPRIKTFIDTNLKLYNTLFENAIAELNNALTTHLKVEKYYINALDFKDINEKTQRIHNMIFNNIN